jgi:hypothetical protein
MSTDWSRGSVTIGSHDRCQAAMRPDDVRADTIAGVLSRLTESSSPDM